MAVEPEECIMGYLGKTDPAPYREHFYENIQLLGRIGAIARSGNVMSPEHRTRIYLSTVIADAPLVADGPLDENPCDDCKHCIQACPVGFMSETETVTFTLGGREITHAAKRSHAACSISCSGFSGLSRDGKWSTLAPSLIEIHTSTTRICISAKRTT